MANIDSRLELYNGTDWVIMPMAKELPVSINKSITDVREPDKVSSSGSKTVTIPFSKESNLFFEFIFNVNIDLQTFNPNYKTAAVYYVGDKIAFTGDLQLIRCVKQDNGTVLSGYYECQIVGEEGGIFVDMGNLKLSEIDWSDLNHAFTYTATKFTPAVIGTGYTYGFVDYGFGDTTNQVWKWTDLKVGVFEREILRRIFSYLGYTWDSDFLDSAFYKRLWIPDVNEGRMKQSETVVDAAEFYAGQTVTQVGLGVINAAYSTANPLGLPIFPQNDGWYYGGQSPNGPQWNSETILYYNDESTTPYFDGSTVYSNPNFTTNLLSWYQIASNNTLDIYIVTPAGYVSMSGTVIVYISFDIEQSVDGGVTWNVIANNVQSVTLTSTATATMQSFVSTTPLLLGAGGIHRMYIRSYCSGSFQFYNSGIQIPANEIQTGTTNILIDQKANSTFYAKVVNADLQNGQTVTVANSIPDVTMKDFFKGVMQRFNLRLEPNKTNPNELVIEPYNDFYINTNLIDWTYKVDVSRPMEIKPMSELQARTYLFSYKEDKDKYNDLYQSNYKESYGTERLDVDNDFMQGVKKNEVIFSNSPIVGNIYNNMAVPKLYKEDNGTVKNIKCNIRSMYWGGLTACTPYTFDNNGTQTTETTYPYVGFVDNHLNPTIDLSFDNPYKLYWNLPAQTFTNNNLYNIYWDSFMKEITDKNSKMVTCYVTLTDRDIEIFSFRNIVFIIDSYYIVNKLMDYNPLTKAPCKVELLKLQAAIPYVPVWYYVGDVTGTTGTTGGGLSGFLTGGGYKKDGAVQIGGDNVANGDVLLIGNNNKFL